MAMPALSRTTITHVCLATLLLLASPQFTQADEPATERDAAKQADAEFDQGQALYQQKKYTAAISHFQAAAKEFDAAKQPLDAAYMYRWKGDCYTDAGDDKQAVTAYNECVARFFKLGKGGLEGLVINANMLSHALKRLNRNDEAGAALGRAATATDSLHG